MDQVRHRQPRPVHLYRSIFDFPISKIQFLIFQNSKTISKFPESKTQYNTPAPPAFLDSHQLDPPRLSQSDTFIAIPTPDITGSWNPAPGSIKYVRKPQFLCYF